MRAGGNKPAGLELHRVAALRYVSHSVVLAVLTGLGLFLAAGVRDAASWTAFGLATLFAVIVPLKLVAAPRRRGAEDDMAATAEIERSGIGASLEPDGSEERLDRESRAELDDVDYLRALRHEFRTPLNAVLGFSDVLLSGIDGDVNASQREDLEIIRASGIRLRVLLDSALDISQLAEGELRLDLERVDVRELVSRATAEAVQLWSNKRDATCTLPEAPCIAEADESRLRRSILVLADFLATSHRDAEIAVSVASSDDHLAIEVTAEATDRLTLDALPTTEEVLAAEDVTKIRQWPVAVTSELIGQQGGSLYHGSAPSRFLIRLPIGGVA